MMASKKHKKKKEKKSCLGRAGERGEQLACLRIPQLHRAIPAGGRQPTTVGRKGDGEDVCSVAFERVGREQRGDIPDFRRAVGAATDEFAAVAGNCQIKHVAFVRGHNRKLAIGLKIPQPDGSVSAPGRRHAFVLPYANKINPFSVALQLADLTARQPIPDPKLRACAAVEKLSAVRTESNALGFIEFNSLKLTSG